MTNGKRAKRRGMAMLMVLMVVAALLVLGQLVMLLMDNVAQRSGSFRRQQRGDYCAEEGISLARAWVAQNQAAGVLSPAILSGPVPAPDGTTSAPGTAFPNAGLLADPTNPVDLAARDLCNIATVGTPAVPGLLGLCRYQPGTTANLYRINLVDDIDEPPGRSASPAMRRRRPWPAPPSSTPT